MSVASRVMTAVVFSTLVSSCYKHEDRVFIANKSDSQVLVSGFYINEKKAINESVLVDPIKGGGVESYKFYGVVDLKNGDDFSLLFRRRNSIDDKLHCKAKNEYCVYYLIINNNEESCVCNSMRGF